MRLSTSKEPLWRGARLPMFGWEQEPKRSGWQRCFACYFWFVGWDCLSLGVHIAVCLPNIEVHVPFGFFRIGWVMRVA